jgi:hypothetical protein
MIKRGEVSDKLAGGRRLTKGSEKAINDRLVGHFK